MDRLIVVGNLRIIRKVFIYAGIILVITCKGIRIDSVQNMGKVDDFHFDVEKGEINEDMDIDT